MTASSVQIIVGHNDRRSLQVAAATVAQTAHEIVPNFRQINAQQRQIVLADMSQQLVDFLSPKHTIIGFSTVDCCATGIGKVAH